MRHSTAYEQALDAVVEALRALDKGSEAMQRDIDRALKMIDGDSGPSLETQLNSLANGIDANAKSIDANAKGIQAVAKANAERDKELNQRFEKMAGERERNKIVAAVLVAVAMAALGYMGWMVQQMSARVLALPAPGVSAPAGAAAPAGAPGPPDGATAATLKGAK